MPFETLTLHGYVATRLEHLPTEENEVAAVNADIVIDSYSHQDVTTVPLRSPPAREDASEGFGEEPLVVEAEVPYGSGHSTGVVGNDSGRIGIGIEVPQAISRTLVSISTSDLSLLEMLRAGAEIEVRIKGNEFKRSVEDAPQYRAWEVVKPSRR